MTWHGISTDVSETSWHERCRFFNTIGTKNAQWYLRHIASDKCTSITRGTKNNLSPVSAEKPTKLICGDTALLWISGLPEKSYMATNNQGTVLQVEPSKTSSPWPHTKPSGFVGEAVWLAGVNHAFFITICVSSKLWFSHFLNKLCATFVCQNIYNCKQCNMSLNIEISVQHAFPWFSWDLRALCITNPQTPEAIMAAMANRSIVNPFWGTQNSDASEPQLVHLPAVPAKHSRQLEWQSCCVLKGEWEKTTGIPHGEFVVRSTIETCLFWNEREVDWQILIL